MASTQSQQRAARIRAALDAYYKRHRKAYKGGFLVPPRWKANAAVAKQLGERVLAVAQCQTFSRSCNHAWSAGICAECPDADHIQWNDSGP